MIILGAITLAACVAGLGVMAIAVRHHLKWSRYWKAAYEDEKWESSMLIADVAFLNAKLTAIKTQRHLSAKHARAAQLAKRGEG